MTNRTAGAAQPAKRARLPQPAQAHSAPFSHDIPVAMDEALTQKAREVNTRTGSLPVFLEAVDQMNTGGEWRERHTRWTRTKEHQHG